MDVINPGVIDASQFDPSGDAATLSLSAQSNFYKAYTGSAFWSAFFSGEAVPGAVRQETNDVGRRVATSSTSDVGSAWGLLQRSLATNDLAVQALVKGPNATSDINLARAYMNAGFSLVLIAETYCQGDILVGPPLTPAQMHDSAIARFKQAVTIGGAAAAAGVAEGTKVVNASNVGIARASLQKKDYAAAIAAAALVPATFVFNAVTVDDASNRALGNGTYVYDIGSNSIVVPDAYRALNDPRVPWKDALKKAQDTGLEYYQQLKYHGIRDADACRVRSRGELHRRGGAVADREQRRGTHAHCGAPSGERAAGVHGNHGGGDSRRADGPACARVLDGDETSR